MIQAHKTMHIDLRVGQSLRVSDAVLTLHEKSGRLARLTVSAPGAVPIQTNHRAQECASSPMPGKEHPHERTAASM